MAEGYFDYVAGATLTAAQIEDYCELQTVMRFASAAARTTALSGVLIEGLRCHLKDLNVDQIYSGSAWSTIGPVHGALTTWTPTVTQSGSVTVTNTYSRYTRVGRLITGWFNLAVTGSGSSANAVVIGGLPATAASSGFEVGPGSIYDTTATTRYRAFTFLESTTTFTLRSTTSGALDNRLGVADLTAALASGDNISGTFSYEASSDS